MAYMKPNEKSAAVTVLHGKKRRAVNIYLPIEMFDKLERIANEQTRTVTAQVHHYLKAALKNDSPTE